MFLSLVGVFSFLLYIHNNAPESVHLSILQLLDSRIMKLRLGTKAELEITYEMLKYKFRDKINIFLLKKHIAKLCTHKG